ncbi:uncharacterized protein KD926_010064 [Aspergillus affinis]|uniref:uncharacterized protein n=1 Tax=Aspergillus affinis TaxID=1070780 RepID=UPI0022FF1687|nr:uncharacterized protein KD926_010064 [Aspergillus affinis]KAI9038963.1 hypothetical protein KD926_010064 [Aspergillus affinis]
MTLSYENTIATAEVVCYTVALSLAVALTVRHGWRKQPCWPALVAFAIVRILGAAMELGTLAAPLNFSLYRGAATLTHAGLPLLLGTLLGLILVVRNSVHKKRQTIVRSFVMHIQALLLVGAFILGIVGATSVPDSDFAGFTTTKVPSALVASVILDLIAFFSLAVCTVSLCFYTQCVPSAEKRLLMAAVASLPFLLVRVVYSALCVSLDNMALHWFKGCLLMFIGMAVVMEMLAVTTYTCAGLVPGCWRSRKAATTGAAKGKRADKPDSENLIALNSQ